MEKEALRIRKLYKSYNGKEILKDINMTIKKGEIYGLVGKNGAGKTTLMRVISSLSSFDKGTIEIFEKDYKNEKERKRIGVLIESPGFYEDMDVYSNLEYQRLWRGVPGKECIEEKLRLVGLDDVKGKLLKDYSLGMKQKLGVAIALLGDPEFLILDEPTNGLDPIGIIRIRNLLIKLNKEKGITILISSHILSELSLIANKFGIIEEGSIISEVSKEELEEKTRASLEIKVDNVERCSFVLSEIIKINDYKVLDNNKIRIYEEIDKPELIIKRLVNEEVLISNVVTNSASLEEYVVETLGEVLK